MVSDFAKRFVEMLTMATARSRELQLAEQAHALAVAETTSVAGTRRASLAEAVFKGDVDEAARLIGLGVDLGWQPESPKILMSPLLHVAVEGKQPRCLRLLLDAGAPIDSVDHNGRTAVGMAAIEGQAECVRILCEAGADVDKCEKASWPPIVFAAYAGATECVRALGAAGADLERADETGRTAASWAAGRGNENCLRALIGLRANIEAADEAGWTPAFWAAYQDKPACLRLLAERGADFDRVDSLRSTVASVAQCRGNKESIGIVESRQRMDAERAALAELVPAESARARAATRRMANAL